MQVSLSDSGLRVAMLDTIRQQDRTRELHLINQLRERNAELTRIQRDIKRLCQELLVTQRQIAAITDAISLEGVAR